MEKHRLRMKIGAHEFDAEGPREEVARQFDEWKALIALATAPPSNPAASHQRQAASRFSHVIEEVTTKDGFKAAPWDIFSVDSDRELMTLKAHPAAGENRDADAILLILYGYKQAGGPSGTDTTGSGGVPVTKLKESLEVSGLRVPRIDRAIEAYVRSGYVLKGGRGKGGIYRLTNTGFAKADDMARQLFEQLI